MLGVGVPIIGFGYRNRAAVGGLLPGWLQVWWWLLWLVLQLVCRWWRPWCQRLDRWVLQRWGWWLRHAGVCLLCGYRGPAAWAQLSRKQGIAVFGAAVSAPSSRRLPTRTTMAHHPPTQPSTPATTIPFTNPCGARKTVRQSMIRAERAPPGRYRVSS